MLQCNINAKMSRHDRPFDFRVWRQIDFAKAKGETFARGQSRIQLTSV